MQGFMLTMRRPCKAARPGPGGRLGVLVALAMLAPLWAGQQAAAQRVITDSDGIIEVAKGQSALLQLDLPMERISVADSEIVDHVVLSPTEVLLNGRDVGSTSLLIWDQVGRVLMYTVEVPADVAALERQLRVLFPETDITVTASGSTVILSGQIREPGVVRRIIEIAQATGATVINNISAPSAQQVLLHVRFAEVSRSVIEALGTDLFITNPHRLDQAVGRAEQVAVETLSEGLVRLFLFGEGARLDAVIRALKSQGEFRSLAEPNLVALEGQEATFLAGGEFPFPVAQGGTSQGITIQWKEFGVRLAFTPRVTNDGSIRLRVAPEVSSLDFANSLMFQGFQVPSLLTRRAESEVELRPGQHLAIAGLMDNSTMEQVDRIPFLGHLPIIGALFRSKTSRQLRTELLVVVTPYLVDPVNYPIPLPRGEPDDWDWDRWLRSVPRPPTRPPGGDS